MYFWKNCLEKAFKNYENWKQNSKISYSNEWIDVFEYKSYYSVEHKDRQVMILPIIDGSKILLVKAKRKLLGTSIWELPAGGVKGKESYSSAAAREFFEETGIGIKDKSRFIQQSSLALASNRMPMFPNIYIININGNEYENKLPSDHEIEKVNIFEFSVIKEMIKKSEIFSSLSISVIMRYLLTINI